MIGTVLNGRKIDFEFLVVGIIKTRSSDMKIKKKNTKEFEYVAISCEKNAVTKFLLTK
jgi:hypothetical protein